MTSLDPMPTAEEMHASWRSYLAQVRPILDFLQMEEGLSKGEAMLTLEMNGVTNLIQELLYKVDNPQLPGDDWQSDD